MLTDERYKQLMEDVGLPNSRSLLQALKQCAMEAALSERAVLAKAMPIPKQEPLGYVVIGQGISFYRTTKEEAEYQANCLEWRDDKGPVIHPVYRDQQPAQTAAITDDKSVSKFLSLAEDLIKSHPFLYVEIARTRTTDWMAMLRERPHGNFIAQGQGLTAVDACTVALSASPKPE